jgi:hypothetical protein
MHIAYFNGPGYATNVHTFILRSCNILSFTNISLHNSSHMLNEMFVKLSILQDPNMKVCTLVAYSGLLIFSRFMPKAT